MRSIVTELYLPMPHLFLSQHSEDGNARIGVPRWVEFAVVAHRPSSCAAMCPSTCEAVSQTATLMMRRARHLPPTTPQ
jgi:hypothetical protein